MSRSTTFRPVEVSPERLEEMRVAARKQRLRQITVSDVAESVAARLQQTELSTQPVNLSHCRSIADLRQAVADIGRLSDGPESKTTEVVLQRATGDKADLRSAEGIVESELIRAEFEILNAEALELGVAQSDLNSASGSVAALGRSAADPAPEPSQLALGRARSAIQDLEERVLDRQAHNFVLQRLEAFAEETLSRMGYDVSVGPDGSISGRASNGNEAQVQVGTSDDEAAIISTFTDPESSLPPGSVGAEDYCVPAVEAQAEFHGSLAEACDLSLGRLRAAEPPTRGSGHQEASTEFFGSTATGNRQRQERSR